MPTAPHTRMYHSGVDVSSPFKVAQLSNSLTTMWPLPQFFVSWPPCFGLSLATS